MGAATGALGVANKVSSLTPQKVMTEGQGMNSDYAISPNPASYK
jgi:hypothetical protein